MHTIDTLFAQHKEKKLRIQVVFRRLDEPTQRSWRSSLYWQVEVYLLGEDDPPVAMGWVVDPAVLTVEPAPALECVRVFRGYEMDGFDRDFAEAVIDAARVRWPRLVTNSGRTEEGGKWMRIHNSEKRNIWEFGVNQWVKPVMMKA
ncbi:hypothetical protein J0H58_07790 [bacterium]|nr:hypothetical protein [bacterium]